MEELQVVLRGLNPSTDKRTINFVIAEPDITEVDVLY